MVQRFWFTESKEKPLGSNRRRRPEAAEAGVAADRSPLGSDRPPKPDTNDTAPQTADVFQD